MSVEIESGPAAVIGPLTASTDRVLTPATLWCLLGVLLLAWQGATWISFFSAGPHQITQFRNPHAISWYAARFYETTGILTALFVGTAVVKQCRRQRRLVLDAKICMAGLLTYWVDPNENWLQPIFMPSSQFVNVADWTGNIPFLPYPDAGRLPEPWLALLPVYAFGFLMFATQLNVFMRWVQGKYACSNIALVLLTFGLGCLIDIAFELPQYLLGVLAYPGAPDIGILIGDKKMPYTEILNAGAVFTFWASTRYFVDAQGRAWFERGLDRFPKKLATVMSVIAMTAAGNVASTSAHAHDVFVGFWSAPYRTMEPALVNDACDAPGITGTRYGPCPGTQGAPVPSPKSLPGVKPYDCRSGWAQCDTVHPRHQNLRNGSP